MAERTWRLSGEYMESCNCDYLCPCIYTNPQEGATQDHCTAALVFRIDAGESDGVRPDGLGFALLIRSGQVMADGDWVPGCVGAEGADPPQRAEIGRATCRERVGRAGLIPEVGLTIKKKK